MDENNKLNTLDNLRDMALFATVARVGSITRASAMVSVPKATLSRRMAALEKRLGIALFRRGAQKIALTAEGQWYLEEAEKLIRQADLVHDQLLADQSLPAGKVRINTSPDVGTYILAPMLGAFSIRYPQIALDVELYPERIDLLERGCDIVLRVGPLPDSQLCSRSLGALPRHLLASPDYLARHGTPVHPEELPHHRCIRFKAHAIETHWHLQRGDDSANIRLGESITTNTASTAHALAEAGAGIALTVPGLCKEAIFAGRLIRIMPAWSGIDFSVHALTLMRRQPARVRLLLDYLAEAFNGPLGRSLQITQPNHLNREMLAVEA